MNRLAFIARAKQLGCSLDEITDLVAIWDGDRCAPVQRRFHELVTRRIHTTQQQIAELVAFASQLQTAAAHLGTPSIDGPCGGIAPASRVPIAPLRPDSGRAAGIPAERSVDRVQPATGGDARAGRSMASRPRSVRARSLTADGRLRVEFDRTVDLPELSRLIAAEQQCCTFFSFTLTVDARGIALEVGAPEAAAEIVDAVFGKAS